MSFHNETHLSKEAKLQYNRANIPGQVRALLPAQSEANSKEQWQLQRLDYTNQIRIQILVSMISQPKNVEEALYFLIVLTNWLMHGMASKVITHGNGQACTSMR
jgi:hypothetical protein